jgi:hypothetical protein
MIAKNATFSRTLRPKPHENVALSAIKDEDGAADPGDDHPKALLDAAPMT